MCCQGKNGYTNITQCHIYIQCLVCYIILIFSYDENLNFQNTFNLHLYMDKEICLSFLKWQIKKNWIICNMATLHCFWSAKNTLFIELMHMPIAKTWKCVGHENIYTHRHWPNLHPNLRKTHGPKTPQQLINKNKEIQGSRIFIRLRPFKCVEKVYKKRRWLAVR